MGEVRAGQGRAGQVQDLIISKFAKQTERFAGAPGEAAAETD